MSSSGGTAPRFAVLLVCTANQCRSPMAEFVLRAALAHLDVDWAVSSAGTRAEAGATISPPAADILTQRGYDVTYWRSRPLTAELIQGADLVLTATAEHRSRVVSAVPGALSRTFPLLQFARLAGGIAALPDPGGPSAGDQLLEQARAQRAHLQPAPVGSEDIRDPIGRRSRAYRHCLATIETAVAQIVAPLAPAGHPALP